MLPTFAPRRSTPALCVVMLGLLSPVAFAQVEVHGGISTTKGAERTAVVAAAWVPQLRRLEHGNVRFELGLMHFDGRDVPRRDLSGSVTVGHLGVRYERDNGLFIGGGIGMQSGYSDALSGDPQFVSSIGWRRDRFSLMLRHVSNAGLEDPNDGETLLLAGWRF